MFSDKRFGLSGSLIAAVRGVLVEEKDQGIVDAKKLKGGKTKVDLEPKTDDDTRDYDDKKSMKEGKEHTVPKTEKEKKLASLAFPKDKITHKDVLVGRGVLAKEEKDSPESIITDFKDRQAYLGHRKQEADHYKRARRSKDVAQQHHYNMASQHNDSANDILNRYRKTNEEIELDEAKRGRPKKNPTPDDEQDEHEHVIMQLRKVVSTHGALPVKHLDGKSTKITPQLAQHALNKHAALKTAAEKQDFEQKLHKSHDSMKSALG